MRGLGSVCHLVRSRWEVCEGSDSGQGGRVAEQQGLVWKRVGRAVACGPFAAQALRGLEKGQGARGNDKLREK